MPIRDYRLRPMLLRHEVERWNGIRVPHGWVQNR